MIRFRKKEVGRAESLWEWLCGVTVWLIYYTSPKEGIDLPQATNSHSTGFNDDIYYFRYSTYNGTKVIFDMWGRNKHLVATSLSFFLDSRFILGFTHQM